MYIHVHKKNCMCCILAGGKGVLTGLDRGLTRHWTVQIEIKVGFCQQQYMRVFSLCDGIQFWLVRPDRLCRSYFTRAVEKSGSAEQAAGGGRSYILPNRVCVCVRGELSFTILTLNKKEREISHFQHPW